MMMNLSRYLLKRAMAKSMQKQYTKEELESLRREGEHLLRVGGEQVARERSNTSPLIYPGDSDNDDDFSYSNSKKNKSSDSDDSEEYNNNHGNSRNSLGKRSLQYTSMDSSNDNSNIVVIGPTLPPPIRSYSGNSTSSSSSRSSSKKRNKKENGISGLILFVKLLSPFIFK